MAGLSPIICPMGATHVGQGQVLCGRGSIRLIVRDTETFLLRHAPRRCWAIFCARWRKRASSGGPDRRVATPAFRKPSSFRHLRASMNWACGHVCAASRGIAPVHFVGAAERRSGRQNYGRHPLRRAGQKSMIVGRKATSKEKWGDKPAWSPCGCDTMV